jgi:hypothetical protein
MPQEFNKIVSFPYNAELLQDGSFDRLYDANDFAQDRAVFLSDGVFLNPGDNFQVFGGNGNLTVTVGSLSELNTAFVRGHSIAAQGQRDFDVPAPHTQYSRIDIVTIRHSNLSNFRLMDVYYVPGTPAASPVKPTLIRNDDEWEIQLAQVTIPANATHIQQSNVLDTRLNSDLCGIVIYLGQAVDTTTIFTQYEDYLNTKIAEWDAIQLQQETDWSSQLTNQQNQFNNWFAGAQTDIVLAAQFDFDNLAMLPGNTKNTIFNADGSITETLANTAGGENVAIRGTVFHTDGSITTEQILYQADGTTVQLATEKTVVFNPDGSITETIIPF